MHKAKMQSSNVGANDLYNKKLKPFLTMLLDLFSAEAAHRRYKLIQDREGQNQRRTKYRQIFHPK